MPIRNVTVYCSASDSVAPVFFAAAVELGESIARNQWNLVYGGNRIGVMGALADAARAAGGKVIGITPQHFIDQGVGDDRCDELVIADNMRQRKAMLEARGDAFVILPGGLGTLEEFFDILVARTLGFHAKPICIVNIDGFYSPLLRMMTEGIERKFIRGKTQSLFSVVDSVADAIQFLNIASTASVASERKTSDVSATE